MSAPYQLLPPLTDDERAALHADIEARGVLVPVELDETGAILDGHNRAEIAAELGIEYPTIVRAGWTEEQKREHVLKLNLARRHLDPHRWGSAFRQLLEQRGVAVGQGARNDQTSATVAEVAAELGVSERTARSRLAEDRVYRSLPDEHRARVDAGERLWRVASGHKRELTFAASMGGIPPRPEAKLSKAVQRVRHEGLRFGMLVAEVEKVAEPGPETAAVLESLRRAEAELERAASQFSALTERVRVADDRAGIFVEEAWTESPFLTLDEFGHLAELHAEITTGGWTRTGFEVGPERGAVHYRCDWRDLRRLNNWRDWWLDEWLEPEDHGPSMVRWSVVWVERGLGSGRNRRDFWLETKFHAPPTAAAWGAVPT